MSSPAGSARRVPSEQGSREGDSTEFVLPPECKNKAALEKSEIGLVVNHAKSKQTKG
ncbi:unnamed protein product, partial [Ectocarpus sp. 12 AP-2014]